MLLLENMEISYIRKLHVLDLHKKVRSMSENHVFVLIGKIYLCFFDTTCVILPSTQRQENMYMQ